VNGRDLTPLAQAIANAFVTMLTTLVRYL
jgi:hypothetical protein